MIHYRKTIDIAPGRQGEAVARAHEWADLAKDHAITLRISVVTTGTLGRLCMSADYESMGAMEAATRKFGADPRAVALNGKTPTGIRNGDHPFIEPSHDEIWRYS